MFQKYTLSCESDIFQILENANEWEQFSKGRLGAIIVAKHANIIPIIRTTTSFKNKSQEFSPEHYSVIEKIKKTTGNTDIKFNNAMVEIYDSSYTKMGFHSDQSLDLEDNSFICLFSCYEDENEKYPRKLVVKNKITKETDEIELTHNSAVIFSKKDNDEHLHKIVAGVQAPKSRWLGLTFRLSKTLVKENDGKLVFLQKGILLTMATEEEKKEFFKYKSLENAQVGFTYPDIYYTLSEH